MKDKDEKIFIEYFNKLASLMTETLRKQDVVVKVWTDNLANLPFVYMDELEEADVIIGVIFKGCIEPWSDVSDDFLTEEEKEEKRAYFSFSHGNYAMIVYKTWHKTVNKLVCYQGNWAEVVGTIIALIKVRTCDVPEMPQSLQDISQKN